MRAFINTIAFLSFIITLLTPFFIFTNKAFSSEQKQISSTDQQNKNNGNNNKVIYGDDNRVDVYASKNKIYKRLALSTAALITKDNLTKTITGKYYRIKADTLKESVNVCSSEKFANQITAAQCSGFLIAPDLLITAGHCIESVSDCQDYYLVFDYRLHNLLPIKCLKTITVKASSVYQCVEVISQQSGDDVDYALVRLDRKVIDRSPLKYRKSGQIANNDKLVVIGHPVGLPTKIADGASVRSNDMDGFFVANLDTYGGNSGSAVFNATTLEVEGILVRGEEDFVKADGKDCLISKRCANNECRGEDVTRITAIKELSLK